MLVIMNHDHHHEFGPTPTVRHFGWGVGRKKFSITKSEKKFRNFCFSYEFFLFLNFLRKYVGLKNISSYWPEIYWFETHTSKTATRSRDLERAQFFGAASRRPSLEWYLREARAPVVAAFSRKGLGNFDKRRERGRDSKGIRHLFELFFYQSLTLVEDC
jgi:hypothetical protein